MRTRVVVLGLVAALAAPVRPDAAQFPPPVDLGIQNIPQQTQVWCWAAVAQQIIAAINGPQGTPPQCALVAQAYGAAPGVCCAGFGNPACVRTGSMPQVQQLIRAFGGRPSALAPPTDPMTLYRTLASRRAVILHIRSGVSSTHVVVLRGMAFLPNRFGGVEPVLYINDPMSYYTQPMPFAALLPLWIEALVVA
jgi:hypothetical protein